jgi:DNA-binding response OmpR family regulator
MTTAAKPRVVCVDDEPAVLESLQDMLRREFDVVTTSNGFAALRMLTEETCPVVLSDMWMPLLHGRRFLTLARKHAPDTVRVVLSGQSSLDDALAVVNESEVFRMLRKPCPQSELVAALHAAVAHHEVLAQDRRAAEPPLREPLAGLLELVAVVDRDAPARAARTRSRALRLFGLRATAETPSWPLARACEAVQLGGVCLSDETRARLATGRRLSRLQGAELARLPEFAAPFLPGIPGIGPVADLVLTAASADARGNLSLPEEILALVLHFETLTRLHGSEEFAVPALRNEPGHHSAQLVSAYLELLGWL